MPLLSRTIVLRRSLSLPLVRGYASTPASSSLSSSSSSLSSSELNAKNPTAVSSSLSSCPAGTVLTGLNYLKGEQPVLAKPDEEYPAWLWELLAPSKQPKAEDDGPGGKAEKRRLRLAHRQTLKDSNLFKTK